MASTAEIELSVKHDDSEDESSSDSDDDTKQVMSHEYLHQQMEEQKEMAKRSAMAAREAAKQASKESWEAIKNAGYLNMVWVLLSLITLSFMCYMAVPEDSQTNTCPEPTSSSKLSTLPLVSFSDRPTSHNFGDYEDIGLHKPDRITEILVAYLLYAVIAIIFGVIGVFFPFIFCLCRFACCLKKCKDIEDNNKCYCPLGKCGKIPPTFHEGRKILYYSKQEKRFPKMIITIVILLILWMVNSGQTEGILAFVSSGKEVYKLPNPIATTVKKTSPTLQKLIYDLGSDGITDFLLQINGTLTENFRAPLLSKSLKCIDNIVMKELPRPKDIQDISQSLKKTDIVGNSKVESVINTIDNVWNAQSRYFSTLQATLNSLNAITLSSMNLKAKSKTILETTTSNNAIVKDVIKRDFENMNQYQDLLKNIILNKPGENDIDYLLNNLLSYNATSNNAVIMEKLNTLQTTLKNSFSPDITRMLSLLPIINTTIDNISRVADILPAHILELTHTTVTANEANAYRSKLPIINETYTFQMIITGFVNKIIEINTTLVNHDLMKTVSAELSTLGSARPCLKDFVNTLKHANKTLFEIPKKMMSATDRVESLNNSRKDIYNGTKTFQKQISTLSNTLKASFLGEVGKKSSMVAMGNEGLSRAMSMQYLFEGLNGFELWNSSVGIKEVNDLKTNQSYVSKPSETLKSRATRLNEIITRTMNKIDEFLPTNNNTASAKALRSTITLLKSNLSSIIPLIDADNNNYEKYIKFDSKRFYKMMHSLSKIKEPNTTLREDTIVFNQTLAQFGPAKGTMKTDLENVRKSLYNITSTGKATDEADEQLQNLKDAIENYTNATSISKAETIINWVVGFQTKRLKNYTISISSSVLKDVSAKYHMGKSLDQIYQLFYDLCLDLSNSTLISNMTCNSSVNGANSKRAERIEDKGSTIIPLGGAHYLMKLYKINEDLNFGTYNTKIDLYNGRTSSEGVRNDRVDGSFCYTNECLKNTWAYYMQSPSVPRSEFNVAIDFSVQDFPALLYGFPVALVVVTILQCFGFCHYRSTKCHCCSCGLCTSYIMSIMAGVILLTFGAALFPLSIFTADACLSLGVSSAKTFTALNPLLCQAIGGTLNSSTLCKINASPFEFNVDVPALMRDVASNCDTTYGFAAQWKRTSKDMNSNIKTMVDDAMENPNTFGDFTFKSEFKNAVKRGGESIGYAVANNTLDLGQVIDCKALNEIYFQFHDVACCNVFGPVYWIVLTWLNISLALLCCGCGAAIIGAKRFMPNKEVSKIRKQFGLEVDLEYSLILSSIKPEEQDEANRWDRERRLLKHHKTKVETHEVQYFNVTMWDFDVTRSARAGDEGVMPGWG